MEQLALVYVLGLAVATILLLAFEKAHWSALGIGLVIAVAAPGIIPATQAVAGFANPAVVTIAALFIVSEGFLRTGAASLLADKILDRTGGRESTVVLLTMLMAALLSAFINNTMVVITFLPVITSICQRANLYPSRLLIPLSYASILGGMCTLVGTSTNLLVSGVLEDLGQPGGVLEGEQPVLRMFDLTGPGILMASCALLYLFFFGRRFLPKVPSLTTQMGKAPIREYVTEIAVGEGSPLIGRPVDELLSAKSGDGMRSLMLVRNEILMWPPFTGLQVRSGDILMASGQAQQLADLQKLEPSTPEELDSYDPASMTFFELALTPSSSFVGQRLGEVALRHHYGAVIIALQRAGKHIRERLSDLHLHSGDVLLVFGDDNSKALLRQSPEFHLIEGVEDAIYRREKAPWALLVAAVVIGLFITGWVAPVIAALIGALLMVSTGCLTVRRAHNSVNWPLLLFIGGTLALSKALMATQATDLIADGLMSALGDLGPHALLAGIFLSSLLLTEILSNNAVAVIMTPVAVATARAAEYGYFPFVLAVALGASTSFANPMAYQTNLLVLGPGGYRFRDYLKIGIPLDLMVAAVGILAIPMFWPLEKL